MSKGWKEVARLGLAGARYPHVLVDAHGWCLRLGAKSRTDEKYYSTLPCLLHGIVEHTVRRQLSNQKVSLDLGGLVREVKSALETALKLCSQTIESGGLEAHIRRVEASKATGKSPGTFELRLVPQSGVQDGSSTERPEVG